MLKIGGTTVFLAALAAVAYLQGGDAGKTCSSGKCPMQASGQDGGQACGHGCGSATKLTSADAGGCCGSSACSRSGSETVVSTKAANKSCSEGGCSACAQAGSETVVSTKAAGKSCSEGGCSACGTAACSGACGQDCQDCPITAAMKLLPQMKYAVGTEQVSCPKAAAALAEKAQAKIAYVIGEQRFDDEAAAQSALVEATEQFVAAYVQPKVCSESGTVTLAGKKVCCAGTAAGLAEVAKAAMDKVQMTYQVGDKKCHCPIEAEQLAKEANDVKVFVVADQVTACEVTARLNLARAKYRAAVAALMQAEQKGQATSAGSAASGS